VAEVVEDREPSRKGRVTGQGGQGLVEYSLVLVLVAAALAGSVGTFGTQLIAKYDWVVTQIP
jgi:Flp pilus assembly pilin Flp